MLCSDQFHIILLCPIHTAFQDYRQEHTRNAQNCHKSFICKLNFVIHAVCRKGIKDDAVVTLWLQDNAEHVGRVIHLDDMRVTIGELDYFGRDPRPLTLTLREVTMASIGSEDDNIYQLLSDHPAIQ